MKIFTDIHKDRVVGAWSKVINIKQPKILSQFLLSGLADKNLLSAQIAHQFVSPGTVPLASGHSLCTRNLEARHCHGYSRPSGVAFVTFLLQKFAVLCICKQCEQGSWGEMERENWNCRLRARNKKNATLRSCMWASFPQIDRNLFLKRLSFPKPRCSEGILSGALSWSA